MLTSEQQQQEWSPYVGPRPFKRVLEEETIFFGRNYESEKIMSLIYSHPLVLVYAQSGAGKTSIFNARIAPTLENKGLQVLPVARVGIGFQKIIMSAKPTSNPYLFNAFQSLLPNASENLLSKHSSLSKFLNFNFPRRVNQRGKPIPQVLIFDQLEELFSFYSDPNRWHEHQEDFFRQVSDAIENDRLLRVVFIIREDYLALLDPFTTSLPERLKPRFRLERLRKYAAYEAVKGPLEKAEAKTYVDEAKIKKLFDEGVIDKLIEDLVKIRVETFGGHSQEVKGEFVEPIQLQVVCQRLWNKLRSTPLDQINQDFLGDIDKALESFYVEAIHEASKLTGINEDVIRIWFDEKLITSSMTRASVHRGPRSTGGIPNSVVDILENKYLIRREERSGALWYEITHDRLVGPIKDSNNQWKRKFTVRSRRFFSIRLSKRQRFSIPVISIGVLVAVLITSFLYIDFVSHEPCSPQNMITATKSEKAPLDIIVSPESNLAFAAYHDSNIILAISCNKEKVTVTPISINGQVEKLAADPTNNKIYAVTTNNSVLAFDSNNHIDLSLINETYSEYRNGNFDDILYDSPEFGIPQKLNVATVEMGTNGTLNSVTGKKYVVDNNSGIMYRETIDDDDDGYDDYTDDYTDDVDNAIIITDLGTSRSPFSLIENPNTNKIYVINPAFPRVSVIDSTDDSLLRNIPIGNGPIDITIDYNNNNTYVANQGSGTISVIDGNKDQVVETIPIGLENNNILQSIAVDSKAHLLYLGFLHDDSTGSISILNPAAYGGSNYIQVSQLTDIDFNPNTSKLYVAEYSNKSIAVIDTKNNTLESVSLRTPDLLPFDIAVNPNSNKIYVGESDLLPFDIAVNPNNNKIYVANIDSANNCRCIVSVISGKDDHIYGHVSIPFSISNIAIDPSSNKVYVTGSDKNQSYLSVIDGQIDSVIKTIPLSFTPFDIDVNSNTGNIYLANNNDWSITMIEGKGDNKSKIIPLSIPPESIVVDPTINRIYVTSYSKPSSSNQQSSFDPKDILLPKLTQIQIINGSDNSVLWNNQTLMLDPKYGEVVLSFNPKTHDLVAASPSTDTIQSWNISRAQNAIERSGGFLYDTDQISAGIDYAQFVLTNNGSTLYIANPTFNTIKVENFSEAF